MILQIVQFKEEKTIYALCSLGKEQCRVQYTSLKLHTLSSLQFEDWRLFRFIYFRSVTKRTRDEITAKTRVSGTCYYY